MNPDPRSRIRSHVLASALLATLAAVLVVDLTTGGPDRLRRELAMQPSNVVDGNFARTFESAALASSTVVRSLRPFFNTAMLGWFRATPPQVIATAADWLFYRAGMFAPREPDSTRHFEGRMAEVLDFAAIARARGVPCAVWLIPDKWRIYGDMIEGLAIPAARVSHYEHVRAHLLANGVAAPDLVTDFRSVRREHPETLLYSPNDTHLTREGNLLLVARHLPELMGMDPETVRARLAAVPRGEPVLHHGDLLLMLQILPDSDAARRFSRTQRALLCPPPANRPRCDVFVMGDSTMGCADQALPCLLAAATGMSVDARYIMAGLLNSPTAKVEYADYAPKLMVFGISERSFASEW